jgi:hypothetical protein
VGTWLPEPMVADEDDPVDVVIAGIRVILNPDKLAHLAG